MALLWELTLGDLNTAQCPWSQSPDPSCSGPQFPHPETEEVRRSQRPAELDVTGGLHG